ncbi:unnamed protein product, partial [Meganyctiphanes norvegica]
MCLLCEGPSKCHVCCPDKGHLGPGKGLLGTSRGYLVPGKCPLDLLTWALCALTLLTPATLADATEQATVHMAAVAEVGERAKLPCDVTSPEPDDRAVLILWYREPQGTPIYSFDARAVGLDGKDGKHWSDHLVLEQRAHFILRQGPSWQVSGSGPGAHLEVYPVHDRDQGVYRCRVDYLITPTKNTIVNFTVVIPPAKPEILNSSGQLVSSGPIGPIGPYNEGEMLTLTCRVTGGRPTPQIFWRVNSEPIATESIRKAGGILETSLTVPKLERQHLRAVYECLTTNYNATAPRTSTVTLDMNFRPSEVSLMHEDTPLKASMEYELVCKSWGSRPPATITWWKGGTTPLKESVLSTSPDANVTTSILQYRAEMTDNGKQLTCRAENALIPNAAKEDQLTLNIYYSPVVTLQMGSNLDPDNIKEEDDVYFECHINANPEVQRVFWYHNIINLNIGPKARRATSLQSFVTLQTNRHNWRSNLKFELENQSFGSLKQKYKPYCRRQGKTIFGTALHEPASVTCEVEANPGPVTFRWTFNNTSEHLPIPASAVTSRDFTSVASYAPKSHLDYGTLLCWSFNSIGEQTTPCAFTIIPAGPPDPPKNCSIANQTTEAIEVECIAAFDGGLPQLFYMEVYDSTDGTLHRNLSSAEPFFVLSALQPGIAFLMVTYAANSKGKSAPARLETFTLKVAEKRLSPPALMEFTPVIGILMAVAGMLILTALLIVAAMKLRRPQPQHIIDRGASGDDAKPGDLENKPLNVGLLGGARAKESVLHGDQLDDVDPDVIPQKTDMLSSYPNYESIEHSGQAGAAYAGTSIDPNVRTLTRPRNTSSSSTSPGLEGPEMTYVELADIPMKGPKKTKSASAPAKDTRHHRDHNLFQFQPVENQQRHYPREDPHDVFQKQHSGSIGSGGSEEQDALHIQALRDSYHGGEPPPPPAPGPTYRTASVSDLYIYAGLDQRFHGSSGRGGGYSRGGAPLHNNVYATLDNRRGNYSSATSSVASASMSDISFAEAAAATGGHGAVEDWREGTTRPLPPLLQQHSRSSMIITHRPTESAV